MASRGKLLDVWTSVLLANNLLERRGEKLFAFTEPAEVSEGEEGEWKEWREVRERARNEMKGELTDEERSMGDTVNQVNDLSINDAGEATRTCQTSCQT